MIRAKAGDSSAFGEIVKRHQHRLQRFATRILGDRSEAEDVTVGAFLRLWDARHSYEPRGKCGAWLIMTVNRLCLDLLSSKRHLDRSLCSDGARVEDPYDGIEQQGLAIAVREAVLDLPFAQRTVLVLSAYEGMSYEEIAEALAIPPGTVASRRNKAVAVLRRRLAAWSQHE